MIHSRVVAKIYATRTVQLHSKFIDASSCGERYSPSKPQKHPADTRKVGIMRIARLIALVLTAVLLSMIPIQSSAQVAVGISVQIGPPALPVYEQPICPGDGYIWTPGYWAYSDDGYYWVPGTWVLAPVGMLWTPGYWAWQNEAYIWYPGYWGPQVGFYGGIFYGFGYVGTGYESGYLTHIALYSNPSCNKPRHLNNS